MNLAAVADGAGGWFFDVYSLEAVAATGSKRRRTGRHGFDKRGGPTETTACICDNPRHAIARSGHQYLDVRRTNGHAPSETLAVREGFLPTGERLASLEDPADTADSYACWTGENADEAAVGWTERVRQ